MRFSHPACVDSFVTVVAPARFHTRMDPNTTLDQLAQVWGTDDYDDAVMNAALTACTRPGDVERVARLLDAAITRVRLEVDA
jgi:hypothetical protein